MLARLGFQAVRHFLCRYAAENVLFITPTEPSYCRLGRVEGKHAAPSAGKEGLPKLPAPCY